jgi:hypothetical protein
MEMLVVEGLRFLNLAEVSADDAKNCVASFPLASQNARSAAYDRNFGGALRLVVGLVIQRPFLAMLVTRHSRLA